jgi:hypothetical protein
MTSTTDICGPAALQLKPGETRPIEPGMSRRGFLRNASLAAAAGAIPVVAAGEVLTAISSSPSPIGLLMTAFLDASKRFGAATEAEDLIENEVAAAVMADKLTYQVRWPSAGVGLERRHFHPWYNEADNWRDQVARTATARRQSIGRNWFGPPEVLHARVDDDTQKAIAQGEQAEAAYAVLTASMGLDAARREREALGEVFAEARAALIGYRPRNLHEVAEKSAALLELGDVDSFDVEALLLSLMPANAAQAVSA